MVGIIEELWNGQIAPIEFFGKDNSDLKISETLLFEKINELGEKYDMDVFQQLEKMVNDCLVKTAKYAFCDGYALGTKITAESFLNSEKSCLNKR